MLDTSGGRIPSIQHNPPSAVSPRQYSAPWMSPSPSQNGATMPTSAFGTSFYDDSSDNHSMNSQLSPSMRPGTSRTFSDPEPEVGPDDERRPSLASVATSGSNGSRGSVVRTGIHKKLQGFFGEEYAGRDGSDASLPTQQQQGGKEQRTNSYSRHRERKPSSVAEARDSSPVPSRPRTPVPSSDVVPFLYQDSVVSALGSRYIQFNITDKHTGYLKVRRSARSNQPLRCRQRTLHRRRTPPTTTETINSASASLSKSPPRRPRPPPQQERRSRQGCPTLNCKGRHGILGAPNGTPEHQHELWILEATTTTAEARSESYTQLYEPEYAGPVFDGIDDYDAGTDKEAGDPGAV